MKNRKTIDVAIIGSGPSGLAAAIRLKKAGVNNVVIFEREKATGGAPRHCGHRAFGILEHRRLETGPAYARRLAHQALSIGVEIHSHSSVINMGPGCRLDIAHPEGIRQVRPGRVIIATGTHETPRSGRLVSGGRSTGICTTGTLQSMFYLEGMIPFKRPVIVGTEPVAYSALLTCRKAGIRPAAMIEEGRPKQIWPLYNICRLFDLELTAGVQGMNIVEAGGRVVALQIDLEAGYGEEIKCDGVLFTGMFRPESSLVKAGHLAFDHVSGSPATDRYGRCSDPRYYASGNVIAPAKMAVSCWLHGQRTADNILLDLAGKLPTPAPLTTFQSE